MKKPRLFVGSSSERLEVARAIHSDLDRDAEVSVWNHNIFAPSQANLESLEDALGDFHFAAFVLAPDDLAKIRDTTNLVSRDNVIFESGLFMGRLGRRNVFLVRPRGESLHLPSDLAGITPLDYEPKRSDGNLRAALGPACDLIRDKLKRWHPLPETALAINPRYRTDLERLDGTFQLDQVLGAETIFIVTGDGIVSELLDRPVAAILRAAIDQLGAGQPHRRAIIVSSGKWLADPRLATYPAISIGNKEANAVTGRVLQLAYPDPGWDHNGHCGVFVSDHGVARIAHWGETATLMRGNVVGFIEGTNPQGKTYLEEFLTNCWK